MKEDFVQAGVAQFGSGWCWWLAVKSGRIVVMKTANGEIRWSRALQANPRL